MKIILSTILILSAFQIFAFAQVKIEKEIERYSCSCENEKVVREYFEQRENQRKLIQECERESEEQRKLLQLPLPKKISGYGPRPVILVKPYYPKFAKQSRISGQVVVEVFTDEKGSVIYSKILSGNSFLGESVKKAACLSKFTPVLYCDKSVKARWIIRYNFIQN